MHKLFLALCASMLLASMPFATAHPAFATTAMCGDHVCEPYERPEPKNWSLEFTADDFLCVSPEEDLKVGYRREWPSLMKAAYASLWAGHCLHSTDEVDTTSTEQPDESGLPPDDFDDEEPPPDDDGDPHHHPHEWEEE